MSNDNVDLLDGLLDATLDDLADAPAWEDYPPGVHRVTIDKIEQFKVEGDKAKDGPKAASNSSSRVSRLSKPKILRR